MDFLLISLGIICLAWYLNKQFIKTKKGHARKAGLWYLKGIVYECGSVTDVLQIDSMLQGMMARGYVREGIDTDEGARFLLDCRIELARELVAKASAHLRQSRNTKDAGPTSNEIDKLLLTWLGPTKAMLMDDTSDSMKKSGINRLTEKWQLNNLGDLGSKLFELFVGIQLEKVKTAQISQAESDSEISTMFERIKKYEELRKKLNGGQDNGERQRLNGMFLELAKECGLKID